jgi:hypothetical protein
MDTFLVRIWSESLPERESGEAPDAAPDEDEAPDAGEAFGQHAGATAPAPTD